MKDDERGRAERGEAVRKSVRERYGKVAAAGGGCGCAPSSSCCGPVQIGSERVGYSGEQLEAAPEGADLGLGCGNPHAIASLKEGETVLDLGSGGGLDCFVAGKRVGPAGRVIGVDMTPEMVARARENGRRAGAANVEFRLGEIEHLPVADGSVDVILSNCVVNLSPDKAAVFGESFRVLRPGGRIAISDIVETKPMPEALRRDVGALTSCVGGAVGVDVVLELLRAAGFRAAHVEVNPASAAFIRDWMPGSGAEEYVASATITATKPARG